MQPPSVPYHKEIPLPVLNINHMQGISNCDIHSCKGKVRQGQQSGLVPATGTGLAAMPFQAVILSALRDSSMRLAQQLSKRPTKKTLRS